MKPPFLLISLLVACSVWATSPAWPDSEELNVQRVITDLAKAYMAFPQTRNHQSVIRFFSPGYSFFDDAGPRSLYDVERMLADLERDLARGPVVITEEITDIAVHLDGALAWGTYRDRVTLARDGNTMEEVALCTAIFRKLMTGWVYQHEHCSPNIVDDTPEDRPDPKDLTRLTGILEGYTAE